MNNIYHLVLNEAGINPITHIGILGPDTLWIMEKISNFKARTKNYQSYSSKTSERLLRVIGVNIDFIIYLKLSINVCNSLDKSRGTAFSHREWIILELSPQSGHSVRSLKERASEARELILIGIHSRMALCKNI